jgi:hypothetical protein
VGAVLHPTAGDFLRHAWAVRAVMLLAQGQAVSGFMGRLFGALRVGAGAETLLPLPPTGAAAGSRYSGGRGGAAGKGAGGEPPPDPAHARSSFRLTAWLRESLGAPGPHLAGAIAGGAAPSAAPPPWLRPQDFSVDFCGWEARSAAEVVGGGLAFSYAAPYPASLLLHGDALAGYSEVTGVLLRGEMCLRGLRSLAHAARHAEEAVARGLRRLAAPGLPGAGRLRLQLACLARSRAAALHAAAAAHAHVAVGVVEEPWAALRREAARAAHLGDLARAHDTHLAAVRAAAFVGPGGAAAGAQLRGLWDRADALADASTAFYAALLAAAESIVGLAEEAAEAEGLLRGGGGGTHARARLPLEPAVVGHAAEALAACGRLFADAEAAGRAVTRHVGFMARAARSAAAAGGGDSVATLAAALEGYAS